MDHNPGYSDEVAEECHDLIDRAEEEAHVCHAMSHLAVFLSLVLYSFAFTLFIILHRVLEGDS